MAEKLKGTVQNSFKKNAKGLLPVIISDFFRCLTFDGTCTDENRRKSVQVLT